MEQIIVKSKSTFLKFEFSFDINLLIRMGWHNKPFPIEISNGQKFHSLQGNGTLSAMNYLK